MTTTRITRLPEKSSSDRDVLNRLLDTVQLAHVGLVTESGDPVVIPTASARDGDRLLIHGSTGSVWMRRLAAGAAASVAVTSLDGIVVARSAFESSMHYRSAVLFGAFTPVLEEAAKVAALGVLTDAFIPGRAAEVRASSTKELAATLVLSMPIERWSLKVSNGWPDDLPEDVAGDAWAGVVPMTTAYGRPVAAPDLRAGIGVPESVSSVGSATYRTLD